MPVTIPRSRRFFGALAGIVFALPILHLMLGLVGMTAIKEGLHYNNIRNSPGAQTAALQVDQVVKDCGKSCSYESIGHYTDASGVLHSSVKVVPKYDYRNYGPITVISSPEYPDEVIPIDYTGAGVIWFGAILVAVLVLFDLAVITWIVFRLRRRRRVRHLAGAADGGVRPVDFRGVLHGPGIGSYTGICHITLTDQEILSEDPAGHVPAGHISLADIKHVTFGLPIMGLNGVPVGGIWETTAIDTDAGRYFLTCSIDYRELLQARLQPITRIATA